MLTDRMRRVSCITAVVLASLVAIPLALAMPGAGDAARRDALVRIAECARGPDVIDRHATFRGVMRRIPRTERMAMRFSLQERVGEGRFRTVKAPGLGGWRKSHPAVRRFAHRQRVLDLAEGSAYRAVVSFRWYDADGKVIRRARRRSKPCTQPGRLPDLSLLGIAGGLPLARRPGASNYRVRLVNRGRATTSGFRVSLAVDGSVVDGREVTALAPGEVRELLFPGPVCAASMTARVDPQDAVREVSEKDNVLTVPCPSGG